MSASHERLKVTRRKYAKYFDKGKPIVDVGFGDGMLMQVMQEQGYTLIAVDRNPRWVERALGRDRRVVEAETEADLPWVLHGADLALSPSPYEGFELPALESLTAAVPWITSGRSPLPQVVANAAVLVNPESEERIEGAIRALLEDQDRREELIKLRRTRARELSWDLAAQSAVEVYRELA